ncbi:hypothetical protein, partial [Bacteroides fragilis]|uniref:hypothetical protein n=1 Tax=Bacteroides fragilis TaxID=817 RepID=UPI0019558A27
NCFKWYEQIGKQIHLSVYQTQTMNRACPIEGGRWKYTFRMRRLNFERKIVLLHRILNNQTAW